MIKNSDLCIFLVDDNPTNIKLLSTMLSREYGFSKVFSYNDSREALKKFYIIKLDALGYQRKMAKQIINQKADYILALKGNHSGMQAELEAWWHKKEREGLSDVIEKNTGKETSETRWYISSLSLNAKQALDSVLSHW